jgi:large subunit ribosomal protein L35
VRRKAFKNHLLEHKSTKRKRGLSHKAILSETDQERVELMMPYL